MSLLSISEIQFLQGQKDVSKSYEYKIKSIIKKKISNLMDKEIPLLTNLFPNLNNLTEFSKDNPKVCVEAPKKLHSPVKHCGLSSRRPEFASHLPCNCFDNNINDIQYNNNNNLLYMSNEYGACILVPLPSYRY